MGNTTGKNDHKYFENGLSLPAILFLVLFVCGLFFILTDNITD